MVFLTPYGLGVRFPAGAIDLARLTIILVSFVGLCSYIKEVARDKKLKVLPGSISIILLVCVILGSALTSSNPFESFKLAVSLCLMWFVFPLALGQIFKDNLNSNDINKSFVFIFLVLAVMVTFEFITQTYVIPPELRTVYSDKEWFLSRVLYRNGQILVQGPYTWNHTLAGIMCTGTAIALWAIDRNKKYGFLLAYMIFGIATLAGVRAGVAGVFIAIILYCIWFRSAKMLIHFASAIFITNLLCLSVFDANAGIFFVGDVMVSGGWGGQVYDYDLKQINSQILLQDSQAELMEEGSTLRELGTIGVKINGFLVNLYHINDWALFGYGFGSFQRSQLIPSSAIIYNDPGIIQLIFLESGLIAGGLFVFILIKAVLIGLRYECMKYYSVGITAWSIFALSSWDLYPVPIVILFVLLIYQHHLHQLRKGA